MKKLTLILGSYAWILNACGDYSADIPPNSSLAVSFRVISREHNGVVFPHVHRQIAIGLGFPADIQAQISMDNSLLPPESLDTIISSAFWSTGQDTIPGFQLRRSYSDSRIDTLIFHLIDHYRDTLRETLLVFANTPLELRVLSPSNRRLDIDPRSNFLSFQWDLQGVDSWETPVVRLYLSADPNTLVPIAETRSNSISISLRDICPRDSACRFYWMARAWVQSLAPNNALDQDSTGLLYFQTRRTDSDLGSIHLRLSTPFSRLFGPSVTGKHLASGQEVRFALDPESGDAQASHLEPGTWQIIARDTILRELSSETLKVSLGAGVRYDPGVTIYLKDQIPPRITLDSVQNQSAYFSIRDQGSGLRTDSLRLFAAQAQTWVSFDIDAMQFSFAEIRADLSPLADSAVLQISAMDRSGNLAPPCSWILIRYPNALSTRGPFCSSEEYP